MDIGTIEAVRYLLDQQTLVRAPERTGPSILNFFDGGLAGGAFCLIVAYNSRSDLRNSAPFVCDGVDDHVEWQAAWEFIKRTGGMVIVGAGDYFFGDSVQLRGMLGGVRFLADGQAFIHHTVTIPSTVEGRWLFNVEESTGGPLPVSLPMLTFEGLSFYGGNLSEAAGVTVHGPSIHPHMFFLRCTFEAFDGRFLFADAGNQSIYVVDQCRFIASSLDGGGIQAPGMAGLQFNSGGMAWNVSIINNVFTDISHGIAIGNLIDVNSFAGHRGQISGNIFINCGTPVIAATPTTAIFHNTINGVYTPGDH
jgi:hypothetical protein